MKKFNRIAIFVLVLTMMLSVIGCGNGTPDDEKYASRPNKVSVEFYDSGWGSQWIKDIAVYYMDNIDTDTYIQLMPTVMNETEIPKVQSGLANNDVYILSARFSDDNLPLVDITDIVKGYPIGESEHTIEEKMGRLTEYYCAPSGKYYQLPAFNDGRCSRSYTYNKTTLDTVFGEGNWILPRTTKEFLEMGDALKERGIYLTAGAYGDGTSYIANGIAVWFAQVAGYEAYNNYLNGKYWDGTKWTMSEDEPLMIEQQQDAIKAMYNTVMSITRKNNGYFHGDSGAMDFLEVEQALAFGFGPSKQKAVFLFTGAWLENEMNIMANAMEEHLDQTFGWMKMPIASELVGAKDINGNLRLTTITTDEQLREVISYVDGDTTQKPQGISDDDIAVVTESRKMAPTTINGSAVIPLSSKNPEGAKKFLQFLASDQAMIEVSRSLNGYSLLPFSACGNSVTISDDSYFIKSYTAATSDIISIDYVPEKFNAEFARVTGFNVYIRDNIESTVFMQDDNSIVTPQNYYESVKTYYENRWDSLIGIWKVQ